MKDHKRTFVNSPRCLVMPPLRDSVKEALRRLRRRIARLPPYSALFILVGPLAVVEPMKLATIFIAGEGHWITSALVMLFAYSVSLFLTHWLFIVVKPQLLTLPWFKRGWAWFTAIRHKAWRWVANRA